MIIPFYSLILLFYSICITFILSDVDNYHYSPSGIPVKVLFVSNSSALLEWNIPMMLTIENVGNFNIESKNVITGEIIVSTIEPRPEIHDFDFDLIYLSKHKNCPDLSHTFRL